MPKDKSKKPVSKDQRPKTKDYAKLAQENLDGWQRAKADYENLIKRTQKEKIETAKFANKDLILQLLPVVDNFEHAIAHAPEGDDWVKGILFVHKQLLDVLKANGVEVIEAKGEEFDPEKHEAVDQVASGKWQVASGDHKVGSVGTKGLSPQPKSKSDKLMIVEEVLKGYTMHGEVIRPAKVKVGS